MRRTTALAAPARRLSCSASSHFVAIHSWCMPCSRK